MKVMLNIGYRQFVGSVEDVHAAQRAILNLTPVDSNYVSGEGHTYYPSGGFLDCSVSVIDGPLLDAKPEPVPVVEVKEAPVPVRVEEVF